MSETNSQNTMREQGERMRSARRIASQLDEIIVKLEKARLYPRDVDVIAEMADSIRERAALCMFDAEYIPLSATASPEAFITRKIEDIEKSMRGDHHAEDTAHAADMVEMIGGVEFAEDLRTLAKAYEDDTHMRLDTLAALRAERERLAKERAEREESRTVDSMLERIGQLEAMVKELDK